MSSCAVCAGRCTEQQALAAETRIACSQPSANVPCVLEDRAKGALLFQALGDAIGFGVEGQVPEVCSAFIDDVLAFDGPPPVVRAGHPFAQYTDDTQLARELGLSLSVDDGAGGVVWSPEDFGQRVAHIFQQRLIVGRGQATERAADRLAAGVHWEEAGEPPPYAGNGAAMRAAPVGIAYFDDPVRRAVVTDEQARVTHRDPRARAAALIVADVVARNVDPKVDDFGWNDLPWLAERVECIDRVTADGVRLLYSLRTQTWSTAEPSLLSYGLVEGEDFARWPGASPFATASTLFALAVYLSERNKPVETLRRAIAVGGDVDTVAAMACAMSGAAVGWEHLRHTQLKGGTLEPWLQSVHDSAGGRAPKRDWTELSQLATRLVQYRPDIQLPASAARAGTPQDAAPQQAASEASARPLTALQHPWALLAHQDALRRLYFSLSGSLIRGRHVVDERLDEERVARLVLVPNAPRQLMEDALLWASANIPIAFGLEASAFLRTESLREVKGELTISPLELSVSGQDSMSTWDPMSFSSTARIERVVLTPAGWRVAEFFTPEERTKQRSFFEKIKAAFESAR